MDSDILVLVVFSNEEFYKWWRNYIGTSQATEYSLRDVKSVGRSIVSFIRSVAKRTYHCVVATGRDQFYF